MDYIKLPKLSDTAFMPMRSVYAGELSIVEVIDAAEDCIYHIDDPILFDKSNAYGSFLGTKPKSSDLEGNIVSFLQHEGWENVATLDKERTDKRNEKLVYAAYAYWVLNDEYKAIIKDYLTNLITFLTREKERIIVEEILEKEEWAK